MKTLTYLILSLVVFTTTNQLQCAAGQKDVKTVAASAAAAPGAAPFESANSSAAAAAAAASSSSFAGASSLQQVGAVASSVSSSAAAAAAAAAASASAGASSSQHAKEPESAKKIYLAIELCREAICENRNGNNGRMTPRTTGALMTLAQGAATILFVESFPSARSSERVPEEILARFRSIVNPTGSEQGADHDPVEIQKRLTAELQKLAQQAESHGAPPANK
jgi:hypothetical protein